MIIIKSHDLPTFRHPLNGSARCLDVDGVKRFRKIAATYKANKLASAASA